MCPQGKIEQNKAQKLKKELKELINFRKN